MATARALRPNKVSFHFGDLPNVILGFFGLRTESELPYETLMDDDDFSVRNYPRHSELRSEAVGRRDEARNRSFDRLFAYIRGENWEDREFAMTTPVIERPNGDARWSMSFYLKDDVDHLPLPKTSAVKLYSMNAQTHAVVRFSGRPTEAAIKEQTERLREWIVDRDLVVTGAPELARFDQPFSIPFLRRNEIHIPIENL